MTKAVLTKLDQQLERTREVERAVLAGVMVDPDLLADAEEHVTERDFFSSVHRTIFSAYRRLSSKQHPIDPLTVLHALTPEEAAEVGGAMGLDQLTGGTPRGMNVGYYAQEVRQWSVLRSVHRMATHLVAQAESADGDEIPDVLATAERAIFEVRDRATQLAVLTPRQRSADSFRQIEAIHEAAGALRGVSTGLRDLDSDLRGLHAGNLILLGARPSQGKSAMALTIAINAASTSGLPSLFFSLEMSADELNLREVTMRAQVDSWRLTHGRINELEQRKLGAAIEEMQDGGVHLVDAPSLTVGQIRAICRRAKAAHGLSVVVIDYVQLITPELIKGRSIDNRTIELGAISRQLKTLARELATPVLLLSQLSREVERRTDKRPQLSDLRESGSLEQDSDVVLLLYRPNAYDDLRATQKYADNYAECIVAKQRNGPIGPVKLTFLKTYTKFVDYFEPDQANDPRQTSLGAAV